MKKYSFESREGIKPLPAYLMELVCVLVYGEIGKIKRIARKRGIGEPLLSLPVFRPSPLGQIGTGRTVGRAGSGD
jgi:hypothetical protein